MKKCVAMAEVRWGEVGPGRLALAHRPRLKDIAKLAALGCQRVVTVQAGSEAALQIGRVVQEAGMAWTWVPVGSGAFPEGEVDRLLRRGLAALADVVEAGESVLVHCSAGIHRAGMLAFALLRRRGLTEAGALEVIESLRPETRRGLRQQHLDWGNQVASEVSG